MSLQDVRTHLQAALEALDAYLADQGPPAVHGLDERGYKAFFDRMRTSPFLGPTLSVQEVQGCEAILRACTDAKWPVSWTAYALATVYHETAGTMQPIREYGRGKGKPYGVPGRNNGQIAYGRGYVQLTWDDNYERLDKELGLGGKLVADYDLALDLKISADILIVGMEKGLFTGKKLQDYLPERGDIHQFSNARRVVNRLDKAVQIAEYALEFQEALEIGAWK